MNIEKPKVMDLLDNKTPALSSTNDIPVIETKPDAQAAPEPETVVEDEGKTPEESATSPEEPSANDKPKARGVQKRLDELTKAAKDQERRALAAEARLDKALAALETKTGQPAKETKEAVEVEDPEPVRPSKDDSDPETYDKALETYYDARGKWIARREVKALMAETERKEAERKAEEAQKSIRETYSKRIEKAREKYPDYTEVAESPEVNISIPMAHAILTSEQGPDIAYYLGKNPAEATRISVLEPTSQLVELGLILAKINAPQTKAVISNAPKPIKPLSTGSDVDKSLEELDEEGMEAYAAARRPQIMARRGPGART